MKGSLDNLNSGIDLYFGKLDDQDRILCCQTNQRHQADLEINVVVQARHPYSKVSSQCCNRQ